MRKVIVVIKGVMAKECTVSEAMDLIWSEYNTPEHPVHVYEKNGTEIKW